MILPNVRASFGRHEAALIVHLVTRGEERARIELEERLRDEGFDAVLDDPRTLNAVMASRGVTFASEPLVFYLLVRHALLEGGFASRTVADYLASVLLAFGREKRAFRVEAEDGEEHPYLVDLLEQMSTTTGRRAFLLKAHLGEFALWLSGMFPDHLAARTQRRGAPGIAYYEELGASGYRMAADTADARDCGLDRLYDSCAGAFPELRLALNRISDRFLFPSSGDPVERLLRQVRDGLQTGRSSN